MKITVVEIIRIVIVVFPILSSMIIMKMRNSKNIKWRAYAEKWNMVSKEIQSYIPLAEEFINFQGKDKKAWVLTKINQYCINNNIIYEHEKAEEILEHLITLTLNVNKRPTDTHKGIINP